jgi:DNA repair exonuclease SbcCD ATPase subunit
MTTNANQWMRTCKSAFLPGWFYQIVVEPDLEKKYDTLVVRLVSGYATDLNNGLVLRREPIDVTDFIPYEQALLQATEFVKDLEAILEDGVDKFNQEYKREVERWKQRSEAGQVAQAQLGKISGEAHAAKEEAEAKLGEQRREHEFFLERLCRKIGAHENETLEKALDRMLREIGAATSECTRLRELAESVPYHEHMVKTSAELVDETAAAAMRIQKESAGFREQLKLAQTKVEELRGAGQTAVADNIKLASENAALQKELIMLRAEYQERTGTMLDFKQKSEELRVALTEAEQELAAVCSGQDCTVSALARDMQQLKDKRDAARDQRTALEEANGELVTLCQGKDQAVSALVHEKQRLTDERDVARSQLAKVSAALVNATTVDRPST